MISLVQRCESWLVGLVCELEVAAVVVGERREFSARVDYVVRVGSQGTVKAFTIDFLFYGGLQLASNLCASISPILIGGSWKLDATS